MLKTRINSLALVALALAPAALAQDSTPLKLSLKEAVALVLRQNPRVVIANLDISQSQEDTRVAHSALLPQVNGTVGESVHRFNIETAFGSRFPGLAEHIGPYWVAQFGAGFSAPVFDLTLWNRYRSSRMAQDSRRADEVTVREESILLVVSQYLGGQRAAAEVDAAQSRVELAQALYDQAADLQKNGAGTGIDTLRANVQLQNEKQRVIVARTSLETSLFGLARLLNIDPQRKIELADTVAFFDTPAVSVDQSLERAYAARPELRQVLNEEQRAALDSRTAGLERLPKVSVSGSFLEQGLTPATTIPVYTYEADLNIPLFTGGRIQAERDKADLAIRQLKQQEQEIRNRIALEVKTAAAQLESARSQVEVANLGVTLARQEVDEARDRFQAGVANNVEVITAQDELARANDNQIAALYSYNQARADLAHAVGQMEALYGR